MPLKNIPKSPFQFGSSNVGAGMDAYEIMSIINMFGDKQGVERLEAIHNIQKPGLVATTSAIRT